VDLIEAILKRRSVRKYKPEPVPEGTIREILEVASHSPIATSLKRHEYYVLTGSKKEELVKIVSQNTTHLRELLDLLEEKDRKKAIFYYADLGGAPVVIIIVVPRLESIWDFKGVATPCGTEIMLIQLVAFSRGLSTCCFSMAPWVEEEARKLLNLPEDKTVLYGMTLGYADEEPPPVDHPLVPVHFLE
jgi:nitroreductase